MLLPWVLISLFLNYTLNFLPDPSIPLSYVSPLMGFAISALPILGITEYLHRPSFTRLMRKTIGAPDMITIERFYSLDPKSRVIVFEHKGEVVGVIAVDGARAGRDLGSVLGSEEGEMGGMIEQIGYEKQDAGAKASLRRRNVKTTAEGSAGLVQIRHLVVDIPVRRAGIATELLVSALDQAFALTAMEGARSAERVVVLADPLSPGGEKVFRKCGFVPVPDDQMESWKRPEEVGLMRWRGRWLGLSRGDWVKRRETLFETNR